MTNQPPTTATFRTMDPILFFIRDSPNGSLGFLMIVDEVIGVVKPERAELGGCLPN